MPFTGTYEHTIDAKNRLSIPAAIRNAADPDRDGTGFYLLPGHRPHTLMLVGDKRFRQWAQSRRHDGLPDDSNLTYDTLVFANAWPLEIDKAGRVLLPDVALRRAGIRREVTILGVNDHVEIWDRSEYNAFLEENLPRLAEIRRQARRGEDQPAS